MIFFVKKKKKDFFQTRPCFLVLVAALQSSQGRLFKAVALVLASLRPSSGSQTAPPLLSRLSANARAKRDFIVLCVFFPHITAAESSDGGGRDDEPVGLCPSWRLQVKDSTEANESAPHKPRLQGFVLFFRVAAKREKNILFQPTELLTSAFFASHCNTISGKRKVLIRSYQC